MFTAVVQTAAFTPRPAFDLVLLAKRFVNHLVAVRVASVERELRRLGQKPVPLDAADFLPFKL